MTLLKIKKFVSASRSAIWRETRPSWVALGRRLKDLIGYQTIPSGNLSQKLCKLDEEINELAMDFIEARNRGRKYQLWMWIAVVICIAQTTALRSEDVHLFPWSATVYALGFVVVAGWYILASRALKAYKRLSEELADCYTEVFSELVRRGFSKKQFLAWDRARIGNGQ